MGVMWVMWVMRVMWVMWDKIWVWGAWVIWLVGVTCNMGGTLRRESASEPSNEAACKCLFRARAEGRKMDKPS